MIIDVSKIDIAQIKDPLLQAVLICLFTDSWVDKEELPEHVSENGGWWGDFINISLNGTKTEISWGSPLWLLKREKITDKTFETMREGIKKSLKPLIDSGKLKEPEIILSRENEQISFALLIDHKEPLEFKGF